MKSEEIAGCVNEILLILADETVLTNYGYTYKDMLSVNELKEIVLCLEYWKICKIPEEWLEFCMDADEDESYTAILDHISNMWLEKANKEIEEICAEIEKATD